MADRALYVMISHTSSKMGRFIRLFTRYDYNHVSLTLDQDFRSWVSYARYHHDVALYGGYIVETAERYLASGKSVNVRIFRVEISQEEYEQLEKRFASAGSPKSGMIYNTFDALATTVRRHVRIRNAYTCLGFANHILGRNFKSIKELDKALEGHLVYEGELGGIAYDNGCRDDMYFDKCGQIHGTWRTLKNLARLSYRAVKG